MPATTQNMVSLALLLAADNEPGLSIGGGIVLILIIVGFIAENLNRKVRCPRCGHRDTRSKVVDKGGRCKNCGSVEFE
jgi:hypothetical protein